MPTSKNVCMKVDTFGSACVTKVGWTSNMAARSHRRQFVQIKRDRADCRLLMLIFAILSGFKVNMKVAIDGPGPAMMGEREGSGTAHDGHISNEEVRLRRLGSNAVVAIQETKGNKLNSNRRTCLDLN